MDNQEETGTSIIKAGKSVIGYSRKIINLHSHSQKCHSYGDDSMNQMTSRFKALVYAMGFEEPVEPDTMQVLMLWIKEQFGDLSMSEMIEAFQMATAFTLPGAPKHYKNFDMQYIGGVLNAYKTHLNKQLKIFKDEENARKSSEKNDKGATDQEMYEGIKRIALDTGKIMKVADWTGAYNHAWKEKLIHRMSEQERVDYKKSVEKAIKTEKHAGIQIGDYSIQSECHKRIMKVHFQEMINKREME